MMASKLEVDVAPDYVVILNLGQLPRGAGGKSLPLDLSELGVHLWLLGFSSLLTEGVITFSEGPAMLPEKSSAPDVIEADVEELPPEENEDDPAASDEAFQRWAEEQRRKMLTVMQRRAERKRMEEQQMLRFQAGYGNPYGPTGGGTGGWWT
jgi:hypothetical protein